ALALLALAGAVQAQSFTTLGALPGTVGATEALGISGDGSTIIGDANAGFMAFRWTEATGMVALGDLPGGGVDSTPHDVSFDGSVIVGTGSTSSGNRAFRWTASGGVQDLGVTGTGVWSRGGAVTADGQTLFGFGPDMGSSGRAIIAWTDAGGASDAIGSGMAVGAGSCSADGAMLGGAGYGAFSAARVWTQAGGLAYVPTPAGSNNANGATQGVSANGLWAVGWQESQNGNLGFVHRVGGTTTHVGDLPGASENSVLEDVSANGAVAVGFATDTDGKEAVIWIRGQGLRVLADYLENDLDLDLGGWELTEANGISDDGSVICGTATNPAIFRTEAFRAEIPIINDSLCIADRDGDYDVDLGDFGHFAAAFGTVQGQPGYDAVSDFDLDGDVDLGDFGLFGELFGSGAGACEP
ncbi:MAG: hypothetical protein AAGH64_02540, partial [Planctomycetota bacterium]